MPFLNAIPLLGELFKSKSGQSNFKTITGIIEVSENDE
jgi:type II secretory pathway component GspD/PulD (secretin)